MKMYYDNYNFYWVRQTPKSIIVEWIPHLNCDGTELDQNVVAKKLIAKKDNSGKHCLEQNDEEGILIYPFRAGTPWFLKPAGEKHFKREIDGCLRWGVSPEFYIDLEKLVYPT